MSDVVGRLAAADGPPSETWAGTALVTNISAGSTQDGRRLIALSWNGGDVVAAYLASYTPVLGHRVMFIKDGASVLVLGNPATS